MQETGSESGKVLNGQELSRLDAYWRAANYLSVGQIYLLDNPLLQEPLKPEHIKPRLLGHWGTTPGLKLMGAVLSLRSPIARGRVIDLTPAGGCVLGFSGLARVTLERVGDDSYTAAAAEEVPMHG